MPDWYWTSVAFISGTVIGSFLNVCIWRLPTEESLVSPGSHCPTCDTELRWRDLIPLLSYLIQRRRCRYCGARISPRYFWVELLTGVYFALLYVTIGWRVEMIPYALFSAVLIAIFFIDLEHYIIPDQLSLFAIGVGVVHDAIRIAGKLPQVVTGWPGGSTDWGGIYAFFIPIPWTGIKIPMPHSIAGMLICGGIFLSIVTVAYYVYKKEGMGGGDIKLAAAIGANLALITALFSFFIAVFLGAVIGVGLIVSRKRGRMDPVPFGPMMVVGAMTAIFFGRGLVNLWEAYLRFAGLQG